MRATQLPPAVLLSRHRWVQMGVSARRLSGPEFVKVFPGYYTTAMDPAPLTAMCWVLQNRVLPGAVISHATAAALLGIPVPRWLDRGVGRLADAAYRSRTGAAIVPSTLPLAPPDDPWTTAHREALDVPDLDIDDERRHQRDAGTLHVVRSLPQESARYELLSAVPMLHCRLPTDAPSHRAGPNVRLHRKAPGDVVTSQRIILSHPLTVILELATVLEHDELVIAVDSLLGRTPPIQGITREDIAELEQRFRGQHGIASLRRALADVRENSASPGETRTRLLLERAGFPEPALNVEVADPFTGRPRYIDLAYPQFKVGIEYQGDQHRSTPDQWRMDQARRDALASIGWNLRYLTAADIARPAQFLSALRWSLQQAGSPVPSEQRWAGAAGRELGRPLRPSLLAQTSARSPRSAVR